MPIKELTREVPYGAEEMFDLVADVRAYPSFIPWMEALRVREDDVQDGQGRLTADAVIGYKMFRERFTSDVTLDKAGRRIKVEAVRGPLRHLRNEWRFESREGGSTVRFEVDFAFKNRLMQAAAGQLMDRGFARLVQAFEEEAARRYRGGQGG
jgi:coenzyme Q-binding protein COQ10